MEIWGYIAGILGGIVLLGNVGAVIYKFVSPALHVKKVQEEQSARLDELEKHEKSDLEKLEHLQQMSKLQCKSMICLLNHMIDGNGIEQMKSTRDDMQDLMIKM